ncbi:MAG: SulP family inorganic anion transporter [Proteobacteria bacterium]|nr:SulP family inorganic anion transporter [Pseudomonadota bacterium]
MAKRTNIPAVAPSDTEHVWPVFRSFGAYRMSFVTADILAGLTLAAIAIPEQMATARLGGFSPLIGFFAFLAGSIAFAVFGSNRFLSSGADSTITPIVAGGLAMLVATGSPDYAALAAGLAIMVGVFLIVGGIFKLGWIADLLSTPVTTGFLTGISAHIIISQLPGILGIATPTGPMLERLGTIAAHLGGANPFTIAIGLGVLAVIAISEKIDARIPGALIGIVLAVACVMLFRLDQRGVSVLGTISVAPPSLAIPDIGLDRLPKLLSLGLIVALVVMVQTAATTRSFLSDPERPPDVNRDFIGVGAGGVLAGLIGAFPVNASPPRTAIVAETGGQSQLAGLIAAAIIAALLLFGVGILRQIPGAALGGVLLFVACRIVRVKVIAAIFRQSPGEFLLVAATAAAIIVLPIEQGVAIGIGLSLLHGIWSTTRARVLVFERVPGTSIWWPANSSIAGEVQPGVIVAGFQAPLSFLNADRFKCDIETLLASAQPPPRLMVLEATGIVEIDFTAAQALSDIIRRCQSKGIGFAIARLESSRAQDELVKFGVADLLGADRLYQSVAEAILANAPAAPVRS